MKNAKKPNATAIPQFMPIYKVAETGLLPIYTLRRMKKRNVLPGIQTGRVFRVNYTALCEMMNTPEGMMILSEGGPESHGNSDK